MNKEEVLSVLKEQIEELYNEADGEEIHLIFVKHKNGVYYTLSGRSHRKPQKIFRKELVFKLSFKTKQI